MARGDEGGVWVGNKPSSMRVKVNPADSGVVVSLDRDKGPLPPSIGITFFDERGNQTAINLKAETPPLDASLRPGTYSGALTPSAQSFVGFEIQIPLGGKSKTVVNSNDMHKVE